MSPFTAESSEPEVAGIVATFNSDLRKTLATITSALAQEGVALRLAAADNGSGSDHRNAIADFLEGRGFHDYLLLSLRENVSTVRNVLGAPERTDASYVKPISPRDYLYDWQTIRLMVERLESAGAGFCFGKTVYYLISAGDIGILHKRNPRVVTPYSRRKADVRRAKRCQALRRDGCLGASLAYRTTILCGCLHRMVGNIMYCEGFSTRLMLADGVGGAYLNDWVMWYEYGAGISTMSDARHTSPIELGWRETLDLLLQKHLGDRDTMRARRVLSTRMQRGLRTTSSRRGGSKCGGGGHRAKCRSEVVSLPRVRHRTHRALATDWRRK